MIPLEEIFDVELGRVGVTLIRIYDLLLKTMTPAEAFSWLRSPLHSLGGNVPLDLISEGYASSVRDFLEINLQK